MRRILNGGLLAVAAIGAAWTTVALPTRSGHGPDAALVGGCEWTVRALAAWLLAGVLIAVASAGSRAPKLIRRLAPLAPAVTHAAVRAAGIGGTAAAAAVLAVPASASTPPGPGGHHPATTQRLGAGSLDLDWPVPQHVRPPELAPPADARRLAPAAPTVRRRHRPSPTPSAAGAAASATTPARSAPVPATRQPARPSAHPAGTVVVRSGDTLWGIAAARLPGGGDAAIQRSWHRWWHANRQVIGADPDLIRPGERLRPPDQPSAPGRPS